MKDQVNNRFTGSRYETLAAAFLEQQGYELLEKNYRDRQGEIDIIARDMGYLVFVEVKYRRNSKNGYPEEAVGLYKQKRIRHTARCYMYRYGYGEEQPCRFDVVSILGAEIRLIQDAF